MVSRERATLKQWLLEDFPDEADRLMELCCDESSTRPLYFSHVRLAMDSTGGPVEPSILKRVARAYIYLTASYYVADAIIDDHPCHNSRLRDFELVPYLQALTATATGLFLEQVALSADARQKVRRLLDTTLRENRLALSAERELSESATVEWHQEAFHMWGRSNSFLFLLDYLSILRNVTPLDKPFRSLVCRLLAAIQRGDDVCDWRSDLATQSLTPFLRESLGCGSGDPLTIEAVEEKLYLGGMIEAELLIIERQLEDMRDAFHQYEFGLALGNLCEAHLVRVRAKYRLFGDVRDRIMQEV